MTNTTMRTYMDVFLVEAELIKAATEVSYNLETHVLTFWICEGAVLQCLFERGVSGTRTQLSDYYINELRYMFPHKRKTFKDSTKGISYLI